MTLKEPVFVWVTDLHVNSFQAVSAPSVDLGEAGYYYATSAQRALFDAWKDAWQKVFERAGDRPVVIGFGGEIVDIDFKSRSKQFITRDVDIVKEHAMYLLRPIIKRAACVIVLRGTEAHVGDNGCEDEKLARLIDEYKPGVIRKNSVTGDYSWHYFRGYIGGQGFDLAHHVNMGGMPRTEKNSANHCAADLMMSYARWKEPLPKYAFRGHVHRVADSSFNYPIRCAIGATWQLPTSFIHRIGHGNNKPDIGLYYLDIVQDKLEYINYDWKRELPEHI